MNIRDLVPLLGHQRRRETTKPKPVRRVRKGVVPPKPSARELFPALQARRLAERPVIGQLNGHPVYGHSTFKNVINEKGQHV